MRLNPKLAQKTLKPPMSHCHSRDDGDHDLAALFLALVLWLAVVVTNQYQSFRKKEIRERLSADLKSK